MDKILTVDDDLLFLEALKRGLKKYETHFQSFFASSVDDAISIMENESIAVLITDIVMPGKGGLDLFAYKDRFYPRTQCIVMTGYGNDELRHSASMDNAFHCLEKPFEISELGRAVMRALWARDEGRIANPILLSTLVELIQTIEETCILGVERVGGGKGTLYYIDGLLSGAECDVLKGNAAASKILAWQRVNFSFETVQRKMIKDYIKDTLSVRGVDSTQGANETRREEKTPEREENGESIFDFDNMIQTSLDNIVEDTKLKSGFRDITAQKSDEQVNSDAEIVPHKEPLRLLVVDDSKLIRKAIANIFSQDSGIQIVGECENGVEALEALQRTKVDVITLDVEMPKMDGLTTLKHLMIKNPIPAVMVSSLTQEGATLTFDALKLGAVDFVAKPSRLSGNDMEKQSSEIIRKVKLAADVEIRAVHFIRGSKNDQKKQKLDVTGKASSMKRIFAIGAAEGGYGSLLKILPHLPNGFPGACLVMLHAESKHVDAFVKYLQKYCSIDIKRAVSGKMLQSGHCYFGSAEEYLTIEATGNDYFLQITSAPMFNTRSNINIMMFSAAEIMAQHTTGIILSGSGTDGCEGMEEINRVGGKTIVQTPESCTYKQMSESVIQRLRVHNIIPDIKIPSQMISSMP